MTQSEEILFHELYHETARGEFLTLYNLEVRLGMSGIELRSIIEDLKVCGYVLEHDEGFQVAPQGIQEGASRWG